MRRSIEIDTLAHQNPIPAASLTGPLLASSIVAPFDPGTRDCPDTIEGQIANLFTHVGEILRAADATWDDITSMTFFVNDTADPRQALNGPWTERFPDPASRPARHTQRSAPDGGPARIRCTFLAYLER